MVSRHGGGLQVVADPAFGPPGAAESFIVHDDNGPISRESVRFDPQKFRIELREAPPGGLLQGWLPAWRVRPYERYFGSAPCERLPDDGLLADLGEALFACEPEKRPETSIPVGYTYLGQFIFHDVSSIRQDPAEPEPLNNRSATLDLDSVFGPLPAGLQIEPCPCPSGPMPVGCTRPGGFQVDLPRSSKGEPAIADQRNDDALPLAQIHMAMIRFFNSVFQVAGNSDEARALTILHFQSVVLHDYLRRTMDATVYDDVLANGRALIYMRDEDDRKPERPYLLPLEFAAACARFGHSMIRHQYPDWNPGYGGNPGVPVATLPGFWANTFNSAQQPRSRLRQRWVTHWHRMLQFPDHVIGALGLPDAPPLMAEAIDTCLAPLLRTMPPEALPPPQPSRAPRSANLATRSLRRGASLYLSSGNEVAAKMRQKLSALARPTFSPLTEAEILDGESARFRELMMRKDAQGRPLLLHNVPLWLYTLKEAAVKAGGCRLGPLASRIVMETLHAAIEQACPSILDPSRDRVWRPDPRLRPASPERYTFPDLIAFAGLAEPVPPF